ncbi:MAG: hypothetical protein U9R75_00750 [Candidatus Thermoplasmatota archaeon]|nr:hypothetical protein [Candidatus Thermoplasmatota archaeon]
MKEAMKRLSGMDPSDDMGDILENIREIMNDVEKAPDSTESSKALSLIREKENASRDYFMRPFDSDEIYDRLIKVHEKRGENDIADTYRRCLDLRQARKWTILGDSYALMGLNSRAAGFLEKALHFGPSEDLADEVRRTYEKALRRVEKAENMVVKTTTRADSDPGNLKNMIKALSDLLDLDRIEDASALSVEGLKRHGEDLDILYRKGVALFGKDEFGPALEIFDKCLEMRPTSANAKRAVNLSKEMLGTGF